MDVSKLTVDQLKVMVYDQFVAKGQAERNIQILESEIAKRMQENHKPVDVKTESVVEG